jgi:archaellum biogenesis ATPase FlaH
MILQAPVSRLLRLVIEKQDFTFLANEGIVDDDFQPASARTALDWLKSFHSRWDKFPEVSTVKQELDIDLPANVEDYEYVIRSAKEYFKSKRLQKLIEQATASLESRDPDKAIDILKQVSDINTDTLLGASFRRTGQERYARYEDGKAERQSGIPTPWPALTEQIIGYLPASITCIIAMSNIGKTWMSVIHACHFMRSGYKVALVSLEDPLELVENRMDSLFYKLSNKDLNRHSLKVADETKWRFGINENSEGEGDIYTYTTKQVKTVSDLAAVIDTVKPDVLMVDAAYRLQAKGIEAGWKTTEKVMDELQQLMQEKNIPIILTVQQDPEQVKKKASKHERLYSTRGGKFFGISSSVVLELSADEEQRLMRVARLSICKNKNFVPDNKEQSGEIDIHWDLQKMEFGEINPEEILEDIEW